jgi:type I restriction enzyme S subunit
MSIDSEWPIVPLGPLTTLISSGVTPKGGAEVYLSSGPVMLIRSQNVQMNHLSLDDVAFITDEIDNAMSRLRVTCGDVLLNITGASIGRVTTFGLHDTRANVNQHVCIIRPKPEVLFHRYLSYLISSPSFQLEIERLQHGGTRQALTFGLIAGGVSNVDIDGNNAFQIKAIRVVISTFETLPDLDFIHFPRMEKPCNFSFR